MAAPSALALLLLVVAATWTGHLLALTAIGAVLVPVLGLRALSVRTRGARLAFAVVGGATVAGVVTLGALVPSGPAPATGASADGTSPEMAATPSGAWAIFPEPPPRFALTTLLPEIDQLVLGSHLVAFVDPYLTRESSARVRSLFLSVYRPMLEDPQFASLPSQLGEAYASASTGQRFVYVPRHAAGEKLPCVVFLHGSGGNFQGYLWVWKALADEGRFVVVAPGFGFGNWHHAGGVGVVEAARRYAVEELPVDPSRVVLAGLSNGGRGVMRAIEADEQRAWRAAVLLSAVVDVDPSEKAWRDRPVLLIHGLKDDRIAAKWFHLAEASFRQVGARVVSRSDPEEDHFLIFSRRDELAAWTLDFLRSEAGFEAEHGQREPER